MRDFSTDDRYADTPGGLARARWSTPVRDWREVDGRWLPSSGSAIWHLPDGPLTYAEFAFGPGDISYNVAPGALWPGHEADDPLGIEERPELHGQCRRAGRDSDGSPETRRAAVLILTVHSCGVADKITVGGRFLDVRSLIQVRGER